MATSMKNRTLSRLTLLSALTATGLLAATPLTPSQAADASAPQAATGPKRHLQMGAGKSIIVDLPEDADEIYVADPAVANAVVRSARRLYVTGVGNGETTIFAMNKAGRQLAVLEISVGRDVAELNLLYASAIPGNDIHVQTVSGNIILTGSVANAGEAERALDIANGFMQNISTSSFTYSTAGASSSTFQGSSKVINSLVIRGLDQVSLRVLVTEIRRDVSKQLGINLGGTLSGASGSGSFTTSNAFGLNGTLANNALDAAWKVGSATFKSTIQAYERQGVARTLAEPTVTAVSGESAKFQAGGTVPVGQTTCTTTGCVTTYTQLPYGVSLNFTPVVLGAGRIQLHVATNVTDIDNSNEVGGTPGTRVRTNETTVELPSGGSIASAGLISTRSAQVINGTPGLRNLPIIGSLFRSRDFLREETELLIVVTPYIVHPVDPKQVVRPDQNFADSSDPHAWLLGRVNRIYSPAAGPTPAYSGKVGFITD